MRRTGVAAALVFACSALVTDFSNVRADDAAAALHVVLARAGPRALLLWNASPLVGKIVAKHTNDRRANDTLERGALRAAAYELPSLGAAKSIVVRVLYDKIGDVSPVYGNATFAGVERYALLELDARRARRDDDRWRELRPRDPIPTWISFRIVGTLPRADR